MEDVRLFIDWLMGSFTDLWNFIVQQHPIVQACVFLPLATMIIKLFISFANIFNGRSL